MNKYEDMLEMEHHVSKNRRHMTNHERAAQFSPFAALTGYEAAIAGKAERVILRRDRTSEEEENLDYILNEIREKKIKDVTVSFFAENREKPGGEYRTLEKSLKRIDETEKILYFEDRTKIRMEDIFEIQINKKEDR